MQMKAAWYHYGLTNHHILRSSSSHKAAENQKQYDNTQDHSSYLQIPLPPSGNIIFGQHIYLSGLFAAHLYVT